MTSPAVSSWVFLNGYGCAGDCAGFCACYCAYCVQYAADFRSALFSGLGSLGRYQLRIKFCQPAGQSAKRTFQMKTSVLCLLSKAGRRDLFDRNTVIRIHRAGNAWVSSPFGFHSWQNARGVQLIPNPGINKRM